MSEEQNSPPKSIGPYMITWVFAKLASKPLAIYLPLQSTGRYSLAVDLTRAQRVQLVQIQCTSSPDLKIHRSSVNQPTSTPLSSVLVDREFPGLWPSFHQSWRCINMIVAGVRDKQSGCQPKCFDKAPVADYSVNVLPSCYALLGRFHRLIHLLVGSSKYQLHSTLCSCVVGKKPVR